MAQSNPLAAIQNLFKTPELKQRIGFTLLCLLIYRIGAHMTAPGIDVAALVDFFKSQSRGGLLGLYDLFVGGGLSRATLFALGIVPYISIEHHLPGVRCGHSEHREDAEGGRGAEKDHSVDALHDRGHRRRCRRGASRCSSSRSRARCAPRASASASRWRSSSPPARCS